MKNTFKRFTSLLLTAALAVTSVFSLAACGGDEPDTEKKEFTVGICQLVQHTALDAATKGFRDGLTAALEKEGRSVKFEEKNASGDNSLCTTIVNGFVSSNVDLIMANATPALQAAYNATETIPILGTSVTEYGVALGIDNFSGTVGSNVSGTSDLAPLADQAQMIIDLIPSANRIGILYCSSEANSKYQADTVKAYLEGKGKSVTVSTFSDSNDISATLTTLASNVDVIYLPTDNTVAQNTGIVNSVCSTAEVPVFAGEEGILTGCPDCAFATLSISYYNIGKKTGEMAAEILLGKTDVTKLPIAYDQNPVKKFNPDVCDHFGIIVPGDYISIK